MNREQALGRMIKNLVISVELLDEAESEGDDEVAAVHLERAVAQSQVVLALRAVS